MCTPGIPGSIHPFVARANGARGCRSFVGAFAAHHNTTEWLTLNKPMQGFNVEVLNVKPAKHVTTHIDSKQRWHTHPYPPN